MTMDGMAFVPGRTFLMGSDRHYPEEAPKHRVTVDGFWMSVDPVTTAQFARFVQATGYVTFAERPLDAGADPHAPRALREPVSLVFAQPTVAIALTDWRLWWTLAPGANWRHPRGPNRPRAIETHPVVQVAYEDALAYARWVGMDLPTEAEWECAARGGLEDADYAWGDTFMPGGRPMANTWHGRFPVENTLADGFERTSPVRSFPPNGYGLYDMIGNVWEWTSDFYAPGHPGPRAETCCAPRNPRNSDREGSIDAVHAALGIPRRVIKGGSHLCAPNYCRRYRPAARQGQEVDSAASHIGFRCIARNVPPP